MNWIGGKQGTFRSAANLVELSIALEGRIAPEINVECDLLLSEPEVLIEPAAQEQALLATANFAPCYLVQKVRQS